MDGCANADFFKPPQADIGFVPKMGPTGEHRGAAVAYPVSARHAAVATCQETFAVSTGKLPLCSFNAHLTIQAVGLAVLVRSARPVEQDLLA